MKSFLMRFMLVLSCVLSTVATVSNTSRGANLIYEPKDMDKVDFYLMTVGLGPEVYMRYGHTMIRMQDHERGQEYDFNWGIFDFSDPMFAFNFFRGIQTYRLGVSGSFSTLRTYRDYEKRKVWKEKINLTNMQKQILTDRIFWNLQPENSSYPYQHFYNNCSTKPRDYLDEVLGGRIREKYQIVPGTRKFRDYIVENLNSPPIGAFGLNIVMNSKVDGPMNSWEEMFLPEQLRQLLLDMNALDDEGKPIPGVKLLSDTELVVDAPDYPSSTLRSYPVFSLVFGAPLVVLVAMLATTETRIRTRRKIYKKLFGLMTMIWGLMSGAFGFVMLAAWLFSRHLDTLHNVNLWIFWPVDFLFVTAGWRMMEIRAFKPGGRMVKVVRWLALGHLFAMIPYVAMALTGFFAQNIWDVLIYILPLAAILYSALYRLTLFTSSKDVADV